MADDGYNKDIPGAPGEVVAQAGRRLAVRRSQWLNEWYVSWSPRNANQNAEGSWDEWLSLASEILEVEAQRQREKKAGPFATEGG